MGGALTASRGEGGEDGHRVVVGVVGDGDEAVDAGGRVDGHLSAEVGRGELANDDASGAGGGKSVCFCEAEITDAHGTIQEVEGSGVIGQQPTLKPGEAFEYTSGCVLTTPVGTMKGSYQMVTEGGDHFDAVIGEFALERPYSLN